MLVFNGIFYQSKLLHDVPGIIHGYSTRRLGDMREPDNQHLFLLRLGLTNHELIMGQQVHGNSVSVVTDATKTTVLSADGLMFSYGRSGDHKVGLGVVVADCVPLLFADTETRTVATVHAGWKGTLGAIASRAVDTMIKAGSNVSDIVVSLGPHIGMCCYTVAQDRAAAFQTAFGNDPRVSSYFENRWHVDIGYANVVQLLSSGIRPDHIDTAISCTSCQSDTFYSYRRDSKETFGEILGVISMV